MAARKKTAIVEDDAPPPQTPDEWQAMHDDPVAFAVSCGTTPDEWQAQVLRSTSRRLILNCARQSGKSATTAFVALHQAIYFPKSLILLISPSDRQSKLLFRKVTDSLSLLEHRPEVVEQNKTQLELLNGSQIVSLPSSEDTIRGFSAVSLIIEDEAAFVSDGVNEAVRPMLAVSNGRLIIMSTPYGKRGHFFNAWTSDRGWEKIMAKASECPRITQEFLDGERREIGEWRYRQEYECEFVETIDAVFTHEQISQAMSDEIAPLEFLEAA